MLPPDFISRLPTRKNMMLFALGYAVGWASAAAVVGPLLNLLGIKNRCQPQR